jgi:glycosyltransferase involved in cell wall biosynthesis
MRRVGLFLASQPHDGGAFQYSQSVLRALADGHDAGIETTVVYTNAAWREYVEPLAVTRIELDTSALDEALLKLVKFGVIPLTLWRSALGKSNHLVRKLLEQRCDTWLFPSQDAWSYFFPVPSIVSIFDLMHRYERQFPEVSRGFKYQRRESHYRKICRTASGLLVDSTVGKQQVRESYGVDAARVHVLPFIAPPQLLTEEQGDDSPPGLPDKYFFYPAQFWSHKNHLRLLAAISELVPRCADIHLVLVGSKKNNYENVRRRIDELGLDEHVTILGYVPDRQMTGLYRRARALVMPTFFGPTNIPPLEAMALGCPVAVSDIYAMPEQLDGAGLLFDPKSVEQIAAALHRLWTDDELCTDLARKGVERTTQWAQPQFTEHLRQIVVDVSAGSA